MAGREGVAPSCGATSGGRVRVGDKGELCVGTSWGGESTCGGYYTTHWFLLGSTKKRIFKVYIGCNFIS